MTCSGVFYLVKLEIVVIEILGSVIMLLAEPLKRINVDGIHSNNHAGSRLL